MPLIDFPTPPSRILLIKPSAIGDVVHALPILNLLRRRWPTAKISWLVTPACAGLLDGHPMLDEVIHFDRKRFGHSWRNPRAAIALWQFTRSLKSRRFDLVLDLQGLLRSGWLGWKTRAPIRVGFANAREAGWVFYTHCIDTGTPEQHAIDRYLQIATAIGCEPGPVQFPFGTTDEDRAAIARLIPSNPFAVLLPGTNWRTKRWPVASFAALPGLLKERFGFDTVIAGGHGDTPLAAQIKGLDLTGKTNLRQLTALLERASLVIANDSGPMHIASALGRPLVTLFGPTNPVRTGPFGRMDTVLRLDMPCSPCYSRRCSHTSCLHWVTPAMVMAHAETQLENQFTSHQTIP